MSSSCGTASPLREFGFSLSPWKQASSLVCGAIVPYNSFAASSVTDSSRQSPNVSNKLANTAARSIEHLGQAIARTAIADPASIKNREYSVITFQPTGQELVDLYTKINGKQAQVKDFTKADRDAWKADAANGGSVKVGYWDRWESGQWGYESGGKISADSFDGPGLEELARTFA